MPGPITLLAQMSCIVVHGPVNSNAKSHWNLPLKMLYWTHILQKRISGEVFYEAEKRWVTLVELIVVIVIILVLAAVLVPSLLRYVSKAKNAAAINECSEVLQAAARTAVDLAAEGTLTSQILNDSRPVILKQANAADHLRLLYSLKTMMRRSYPSDIYRKTIFMWFMISNMIPGFT